MKSALRLKALALALLAGLLQACQTMQPVIDDGVWFNDADYFNKSESTITEQLQWRYAGKVGLTTATLKEQANLDWQFADQTNVVRLFGPLGAGAIKLEFDHFGAQLSDRDGIIHQGASAQALLSEVVGWPLPIDALLYWLQGRPLLDQAFEYRLNNQAQVQSIRQQGWQIDYLDYRDFNGRFLPRKITAYKRFVDAQQGDVKVKLVTKSWQ